MIQEKPIFIGGIQRSGTSMIRAIIGSHPDVALLEYDIGLWTSYFPRYKYADTKSYAECEQVIEKILRLPKMNRMTVTLDKQALLDAINKNQDYSFTNVIRQILKQYAALKGKPRWGVKTPNNEFFTEDIFGAFPDSKFVHVIRDPRDVAVSAIQRGWRHDVVQHRRYWRKSIDLAQQNERRYPGQYITVYYESLLDETEKQIRRICDVLELDFQNEMISMKNFPRPSNRNSSFSDNTTDNNSPFYSNAIGRYNKYLPPVEIAFYQQVLKQPHYKTPYPLLEQTLTQAESMTLAKMTLVAASQGAITSFLTTLKITGPLPSLPSTKKWLIQLIKHVKTLSPSQA